MARTMATRVTPEPPPRRRTTSDPGENLFKEVLVESHRAPRSLWQRMGGLSVTLHLAALAILVFVPLYTPPVLPESKDYIRALLYDPPPPPPPPLPKGTPLHPQKAKPEVPKPVIENPAKPQFTAPVQVPDPKTAKIEPEPGVKPEDQFGSLTGSDLGDPIAGMEEGVEGGVPGGVPGGVLGGVLGGTGTGPVMDYDQGPRPVKITRPQYPQEAFIKKIEGTVLVEILIDSQGRVVRARVLQSVPMLDQAALQTVYQWVFQPAVKHGRPVPTIAHAPVAFRIY
jgi:protein TonB